jgi:putative ATP-binding cassette transporter
MSEQPAAFDRATRRHFARAVKDFLTSEVRWRARGLFALLIAFALTINGLNVVNSYVGRDFMTAISDRDQSGFARQAVLYVGVFAASTECRPCFGNVVSSITNTAAGLANAAAR